MFDTIKEAAKIGMGAVWLSRENLKKLTDDLAEMGKVSKEEGERLFNEFDKSSEEYKKKFTEQVEAAVQQALDKAGLAKRSEVDELRVQVAELEEKLNGLSGNQE